MKEKQQQCCYHNRQTHFLVKPLITFHKMAVDYTAEIKFLGIQIMDKLRWHCHVQLLAGKLCEVVFMIKSLKEVLSLNLIRNIYFTKFHSILRFGILFCGEQRVNCVVLCEVAFVGSRG